MSGESFIALYLDPDGQYRGWLCFAGRKYDTDSDYREGEPFLVAKTLKEALNIIDENPILDYGVLYMNFDPEEHPPEDEGVDEGAYECTCPICGGCGVTGTDEDASELEVCPYCQGLAGDEDVV